MHPTPEKFLFERRPHRIIGPAGRRRRILSSYGWAPSHARAPSHACTPSHAPTSPPLVIEILSPTTARRDRTVKLDLYRRLGVAEYWVVDPEAEQVEVWRLAAGATEPERYTENVPVRLGDRQPGVIELKKIFERPA